MNPVDPFHVNGSGYPVVTISMISPPYSAKGVTNPRSNTSVEVESTNFSVGRKMNEHDKEVNVYAGGWTAKSKPAIRLRKNGVFQHR